MIKRFYISVIVKRLVTTAVIAIFCAGIPFAHEGTSGENNEIIRPVNSVFSAYVGGASVLDTYLTPIRYKGLALRLGYERYQAMKFSPYDWIMQLTTGATYNNVNNIVKSHKMQLAMVDFQWGMQRRWKVLDGLQLSAGGTTSFDGGVIYNPLNSNNPVSVKLHWSLNPTAMAVYNMRIGNMPVTFRYQAIISAFGLFFSPDYGEAFYEIYVGNHSGLVHVGWWGNRFDMQNILTADLHIGNTVIRVGYTGTIQSSWVSNINTQIYNNYFTIGVGGDWMSVSPRTKIGEKAKILSAIY